MACLMIDLSLMNRVQVDPHARRVRVQGGALLGTLDGEAQHYGLATTAGNVSHTGVGGLTLASGMGWLARQFGLACANVVSCEVVTAEGAVVRASEPALSAQLSEPRRNDGRARHQGRSYHDLSPGSSICSRAGEALPTASESLQ
jgi:FAD/FMN-containing dehydrogenase